MDSSVGDTITAVMDGIFPLLGVLLGALLTWRIGRGRERRDVRRDIYVEWLKAARLLGSRPSDAPTPTQGTVQIPHPAMKQRINEATVELELVASREVIEAGNRYIAAIRSPNFAAAMNRPPAPTTFDDGVDRFQDYMETARKEVVSAMRKDLGVAKG